MYYFCASLAVSSTTQVLLAESNRKNGPVVQLVRMPPCHGGGRGFESRPVRKKPHNCEAFLFYGILRLHHSIESDGTFYKGSSENPVKRLEQHNLGFTISTKHKRPWKLVYVEEMPTKSQMLIREKKLKEATRSTFKS